MNLIYCEKAAKADFKKMYPDYYKLLVGDKEKALLVVGVGPSLPLVQGEQIFIDLKFFRAMSTVLPVVMKYALKKIVIDWYKKELSKEKK